MGPYAHQKGGDIVCWISRSWFFASHDTQLMLRKWSCHHHISMSKIFWCDEFCLSELRASLCLSPYIFETPCWPLSPCPILDFGPNLNWTPGLGICQRHFMAARVLNERYKTRFLSKYASRAFELWRFVNIYLLRVKIKENKMFLWDHIMTLHRI